MADRRERVGGEDVYLALAEVDGLFDGFKEAGAGVGGGGEAVLGDEEVGGGSEGSVVGEEVVDAGDGDHSLTLVATNQDADVGLAFEVGEDFGPGEFFGLGDLEGDDDLGAGRGGAGLFPDGGGCIVLDGFAGGGVEAGGDVAEPDFKKIGELGHGSDRGTRGFDGVGLLDGDGRADVLDAVDLGLVEEVEELARVGGECFDVAALALGVERVENEGAFARAGEAGDDDVFAEGQVEVEALQVVLTHAAQADAFGGGFGLGGGKGGGGTDHV